MTQQLDLKSVMKAVQQQKTKQEHVELKQSIMEATRFLEPQSKVDKDSITQYIQKINNESIQKEHVYNEIDKLLKEGTLIIEENDFYTAIRPNQHDE